MPTIRSAYDAHERLHPAQGGPSRTKQSMQAECDINNIMKRYEKTGLLEHVRTHQGQYGDFVTGEDYHGHLNQVRSAETAFLTLPARIRTRFNNDPAAFLDFVQNPDNIPEMIKMGLAKPIPIDIVNNADPVPEPAPASPAPADNSEPANLAGSEASPSSAT